MFIRLLAKDLYTAQKKVEMLEQQLKNAGDDQEQLKDRLRQANAELLQLRKIMEGRKEQSSSSLHKKKSRF